VYFYLLFGSAYTSAPSAANACYLQYQAQTHTLMLQNNAGTGFSATLSNSQCTVGAATYSVSANTMTIQVPVTFTQAFAETLLSNNPYTNGSGVTYGVAYVYENVFDNGAQLYPQYQGPWGVQGLATVTPATATVAGSQTQVFTADEPVTWTATLGSVSPASGTTTTYTAPAATGSAQTATVTATASSGNAAAAVVTVPALPATISPTTATVTGGRTQGFTANEPVTWTATLGSVSPASGTTTTYTAPAATASQQTATVTATAAAGNSAQATVTIPAAASVTPTSATVAGGQTQGFTANQAVTWSTTAGSVTPTSGTTTVFTAPAATASQQTVTVTATVSSGNAASATVTVPGIPATTISPSGSVTISALQTQTFNANQSVTWNLSGAGSISTTSGVSTVYTAPSAAVSIQTATLKATNSLGSAAQASITVPGLSLLSVSPLYTYSLSGQATTFTFGGGSSAPLSNANVYFYLLFNPVYAPAQANSACYLQYQTSTHTLMLANDAGGFTSTLSNSQCSVGAATYSVSGNTMTIQVAVTFTQAFAATLLSNNPYTNGSGVTYGVSYVYENVYDNGVQLYPQEQGPWGVK
jgi:hypothetical protein